MGVRERWHKTRRIPLSTEDALSRVEQHLRQDERIRVLYLFGSRRADLAGGPDQSRPQPDSRDLDLGVVTSRDFAWEDYYILLEELGGRIRSDRLDLIWLNEADPVMAFQVIRDGSVLLYRDAEELNDFERKAKHRFYDYRIYLKQHEARRRTSGEDSHGV